MTTSATTAIDRVAQAALRDPSAFVATYAETPIAWTAIASNTAAIVRVRGTTHDGRAWRAVRKTLRRAPNARDEAWRREATIYASGMLADLPGIGAPACLLIEDRDAEVALWLEDIEETVRDWPLTRYALAARHLGRFNGAYLAGRPLPARHLLRTDWLRSWVRAVDRRFDNLDDPRVVEHALVRVALPAEHHPRLRDLRAASDALLDRLDALPATFSHLDAWRANLLAADGGPKERTVAIDWSVVGLAPAGQELAVFLTGSRVWLGVPPEHGPALERGSFAAYLAGLRDEGWRGAEDDARFAFCASAALWACMATPAWLGWVADPVRAEWLGTKFGRPLAEAVGPWGAFLRDALDLGEEALARMRS